MFFYHIFNRVTSFMLDFCIFTCLTMVFIKENQSCYLAQIPNILKDSTALPKLLACTDTKQRIQNSKRFHSTIFEYLMLSSGFTCPPSFFHSNLGSGSPRGPRQSSTAVSPTATSVFLGCTRKSSFIAVITS